MSARAWGVTAAERAMDFPCDRYVERPDEVWHRGTDVLAPVPLVYRWLCQLRVAPYSYDAIDNLGAAARGRSPPASTGSRWASG